MRKFFIILFLLVTASLSAQTSRLGHQRAVHLTKQEVVVATDLYRKMMQSQTYKLFEEERKVFSIKLKGVNPFPDTTEALNWPGDSIRNYTLEVIKNNLYRTDFASVEEARKLLISTNALMSKQVEENPELYDLMSLANAEQMREILSPMFQAKRDELLEP